MKRLLLFPGFLLFLMSCAAFPTDSILKNQSGPVTVPHVVATPTPAVFTWDDWARRARIAGAYFEPGYSDVDIEAQLDKLVAQHVSVVLADSPWGQQYNVWADDDKFFPVRDVVAKMVEKAHTRGLKVVMYQTGLELLSDPPRNPATEHLDWAQRGLDGKPILYNDVSVEQEHWLKTGIWDLWASPCSEFGQVSLARVREMVATGIDGLWVDQVYLQSSVGNHDDLWPSTDACSAAAFQAATGLTMPKAENWDDPTWRQWIVWRHTQIADFLLAEKQAAREVNPGIVFFNENSDVDTSRSTYVANDPAMYLANPDMSTGHEVETIGDRMDEGETGMKSATLDQWLAFRTMICFARGVDRGKPSWILTYGYEPRDSTQLAGMVLAEGANFYETKGPQMADTAGEAYRTKLFGWMAEHEAVLFDSESRAQVALVYSPRTRDLVDSGSGDPYDVGDATHFAAYRAAANVLYRARIPFDVVMDTDTTVFNRYAVIILPQVQAMSDVTANALRSFSGRLITIGDTGRYDEWLKERVKNALADIPQQHYTTASDAIVAAANTGLLTSNAPASVQIGLRKTSSGYALVLVNTSAMPTDAFDVNLKIQNGEMIASAQMSTLEHTETAIPFAVSNNAIRLSVPAGINLLALLTLTVR